jgi:GTP-binding protein
MAFVDECVVYAKAGRGGNGSASFHSEPYKPRGGPDGGKGGDGGSVIFEVSAGVHDLSWLSEHPHQRAASGASGRNANRDGATGADCIVAVPDGTVVSDDDGLLADLVGDRSRAVVARGGRGGRGNVAFANARNRAPRTAESGERGEERRLQVELRVVADVGLVGLPNAGKSTLLSRLTAARPKIADYPFTTLTPNLGVAGDDAGRFVVADIPGLVEGAHEGRGLGHRFLRHVTRCRALVLIVDLAAPDPAGDLGTLRGELAAYGKDLSERLAVVVGSKADLVNDPATAARALSDGAIATSATTGLGLNDLLERLGRLSRESEALLPAAREPFVVLRPGRPRFTVSREGGRWLVAGRGVERLVLETDLDDEDQLVKLQRRLEKEGVERTLASRGAGRGDEILIAGRVFEFLPGVAAGGSEPGSSERGSSEPGSSEEE